MTTPSILIPKKQIIINNDKTDVDSHDADVDEDNEYKEFIGINSNIELEVKNKNY
jgi:hypothetical protein